MSQVIRISDDLYRRLESHASGFDTPSNVIEIILNAYEGKTSNSNFDNKNRNKRDVVPAVSLEILYASGSQEQFKNELLTHKKAYIKLQYTDGTSEIKEWNASRFNKHSSVDGNLRSGYLRGWKKRGICKAELGIHPEDITV